MTKWRAHLTRDPGAEEGYQRFKKAIGLPPWAPPSDSQRLVFDTVFNNEHFDFDRFLELAASGEKIAECMRKSRRLIDGKPTGDSEP